MERLVLVLGDIECPRRGVVGGKFSLESESWSDASIDGMRLMDCLTHN